MPFSAHFLLETRQVHFCQTLKLTELLGFDELMDEKILHFMGWV